MKIQKQMFFGGSGGGGRVGGVRVNVNEEMNFCEYSKINLGGRGIWGGVGLGGQGGC